MQPADGDVFGADPELDELAAITEFELEHRRILDMQALYRRRTRDEGAA